MASTTEKEVYFGQFEVSSQVFHQTTLCFCLVNLKPLLSGHVLVIPHRKVARFTDLTAPETSEIFSTVQKVQRMLAHVYFSPDGSAEAIDAATNNDLARLPLKGEPEDGSFNIALQDGVDAGQSVSHVHVHIIPRLKGNGVGDGIYDRLASEEGNIGGHQYDTNRPVGGGAFPRIEDADRKARSLNEMNREAAFYNEQMTTLGL